MKYPEYSGRSDYEPWSIRQSAIYHGRNRVKQQHVCILVSPLWKSKAEVRVIEQIKRPRSCFELDGFTVSEALWSSYVDNWKPYMSYYERQLQDLVSQSFCGPDECRI